MMSHERTRGQPPVMNVDTFLRHEHGPRQVPHVITLPLSVNAMLDNMKKRRHEHHRQATEQRRSIGSAQNYRSDCF